MDKLKGVAKGGWHPSRDAPIHRDSWKSDIKGMATGKKKDPHEEARNHQSTPITTLRDPDSFGAPPKRNAYGGSASTVTAEAPAQGGWGAHVPAPSRRRQEEAKEEIPKPPPEPYRKDTTGLRTDNLPKPPVRRVEAGAASPARTASPSLPPRQSPALPTRQATKPPPGLPPRQTENPNEFTPPPPPSYGEATSSNQPSFINEGAAARLAGAGVSVPGFGIGGQSQAAPAQHGPQLGELQQRFSRMNTGSQTLPHSPQAASAVTAAAGKKPPPPPPPKKVGLGGSGDQSTMSSPMPAPGPPPLPLSSKPRPPRLSHQVTVRG
ncbi:hypothetical protein LTR15_004219 [Elasticomyces elasticus]|nr:hypothetical protein LTR15_004219 [Elasticomyces elasticus]